MANYIEKYIEKWVDAKGDAHYIDQAGYSYEPVSNTGIGSWFGDIFAPKEGGTVVGNIVRAAGTLVTGGSTQVVQPQTTVPIQQPTQQNYPQQNYAPAPANNNNTLLIIGAGIAALAAIVVISKNKGK